MKEIAIFSVILVILVTALAGVVQFVGGHFGLRFGDSWYLALIAFVLVAPAILNIHIFARAPSSETVIERMMALIRAIGMTTAAVACASTIFIVIEHRSIFLWVAGIGFVMTFGTLPLEALLNRRRTQ